MTFGPLRQQCMLRYVEHCSTSCLDFRLSFVLIGASGLGDQRD